MPQESFSRRKFLKGSTAVGAGLAISSLTPAIAKATTLQLPEKWDYEADIVVAGAGVAGCMAAIEAANKGLKVLLLQADMKIGGNSGISSGWIRSVNTKWHKERNIVDTVEAYTEDGIAYGQGTRNPKKVRVIAEKSGEFIDRLISYGVKFTNDADTVNGGPTLRVVKTDGKGAALMKQVQAVVLKNKNITLKIDSKVLDIYKTTAPDILKGVKAEIEGDDAKIKCSALVLATGGFGRNQPLIEKYTNEWKDTLRIMDLYDKGDGLIMATSHGAGSANLQIGMIVSTMAVANKVFYSTAPLVAGGILVNQDGHRFVNELVTYTDTPRACVKQKHVYEIIGEGMHPKQVESMLEGGALKKVETVQALAEGIGASVSNVQKTIEEYNSNARNKVTADQFGRTSFPKELKAPYYYIEIWPVMLETVGGIFINEKSEVISFREEPIMKGFYAAGAVAFGEHFGRGYRSGDAYAYSGVTGMVAGNEAADYVKKKV